MRRTFLFLFQLVAICCIFSSCSKEEGEGGKGTIFGAVYKIIDDGSIIKVGDTYTFEQILVPARDEDVYVIYGNNQYGYDGKTKTGPDGTYRFDYLNDGSYTVYSFSDMSSGEKVASLSPVTIKDGGKVCAPEIYIQDGKNIGKCGIVGNLEALYKEASSRVPGVGIRVYAQKLGSTTVSDVRTDKDGVYAFAKLDPNSVYNIYAESEPIKGQEIIAEGIQVTTGEVGTISIADEIIFVMIK